MTVGCECSIFKEYWNAKLKSVVHSGFTFADVTERDQRESTLRQLEHQRER